jgi:hypothetical protein
MVIHRRLCPFVGRVPDFFHKEILNKYQIRYIKNKSANRSKPKGRIDMEVLLQHAILKRTQVLRVIVTIAKNELT